MPVILAFSLFHFPVYALTPLLQSVQIGDVEASADSAATAEGSEEIAVTLFDLVQFGGWWLVPLLALLVLAVYLFAERYQTIRKSGRNPESFNKQVQSHVRNGDLTSARALCESTNTPYARMVLKGINHLGQPLGDIAASIENEAKLEVQRLEKRVAFLATIAGAAPMLGFLGTVAGMILAFMKISYLEGNVNPSVLAEGIYKAMITTAAGLLVGIPAYVGYNVLTNMINGVVFKMEVTTTEFIELLNEPARA